MSTLIKNYQLAVIILVQFVTFSASAQHNRIDSLNDIFLNNQEQVMVAAHRSAHQHYPENSIAAINEAVRLGLDIAEVDVQQTKDSVLVLLHDEKLNRTTTGKGFLKDYTYAQLQQFRLLQNGQPTNETIPTLQQALKAAKCKILVDLDFKLDDAAALKKMYALIEHYQCEDQVLVFLYDYKKMLVCNQMNPRIKLMPRAYSAADVNNILALNIAHIIHIDETFYSDTLMKTIADRHVRIWSNSLGKYDDLEENNQSGFKALLTNTRYVNVVQTNLPEQWVGYLRQIKRR